MTAKLSLLPPLLRNGAFYIDNSSFEHLFRCEREALYALIHKRQWNGDVSALNFGSSCHAGLAIRYRNGGMAMDSFQGMMEACSTSLAKLPCEPGDWRNLEYAVEVMRLYCLEYPYEDFEVLTMTQTDPKDPLNKINVPLVELPFAVPLGTVVLPQPMLLTSVDDSDPDNKLISLTEYTEIPIVWMGKIDLIVRKSGKIWFPDHKSTSMFGPNYFDQFNLHGQFSGYKWALQEVLKTQVEGVIVNVLAIRKPTKTGKGIEFGRREIPIPQYQVDEWRDNTLSLLADFFSMLEYWDFPMRTVSCINKWGRKCDYYGVCALPPNQREIYLNTGDYKNTTWSPLNAD